CSADWRDRQDGRSRAGREKQKARDHPRVSNAPIARPFPRLGGVSDLQRSWGSIADCGLRIADSIDDVFNPQSAIANPQFHATLLTANVTLCPPNPNEFDKATSICRSTAWFGAECKSQ